MVYISTIIIGLAFYLLNVQRVPFQIPEIILVHHVLLDVRTAQLDLYVAVVMVVIRYQEIYVQIIHAMQTVGHALV